LETVRATDIEILSRLTKLANGKGVALTYAHKLFFLRLLDYASKTGGQSECGLTVALSVEGVSKALETPLRTSIQSLNRLTSCGALQRKEGEKTFPRSPTITTVPKYLYEKEIQHETDD